MQFAWAIFLPILIPAAPTNFNGPINTAFVFFLSFSSISLVFQCLFLYVSLLLLLKLPGINVLNSSLAVLVCKCVNV